MDGHASEHSTHLLVGFCLGHCEKAVNGDYGKYVLVLGCLYYILLADLKLYLSTFESKQFPLRLGK